MHTWNVWHVKNVALFPVFEQLTIEKLTIKCCYTSEQRATQSSSNEMYRAHTHTHNCKDMK